MTTLGPGSTIGIVGGGQLGRMLAQSARQHGYGVAVLTGGAANTPAGVLADHEFTGAFDNADTVAAFFDAIDVMTWEFENVDVALAASAQAAGIPVRPSGAIIAAAQDRKLEKEALAAAGVTVAPWRSAETAAELETAIAELGSPVIAKTARFGYDGKGQIRINDATEVAAAWETLGGARLVVESVIDFERELSVVVARGVDGTVIDHGVMENTHANHILDTTVVPAQVADTIAEAARKTAHLVAEGLDLVGVLCVELFDTGPAGILVNEIAPRPHNSGHCTIEAAAASQFEQQLRAVAGQPLGDGSCAPAAMAQLLGDEWDAGEPDWTAVLGQPGIHLHLYGKGEPRTGRKMGHVTCVSNDAVDALQRVLDARAALTAHPANQER
ncbi:MAG: 5-(carboxyamino)imidazole ribonucleotide synthase [Actinomycetota bacterium]